MSFLQNNEQYSGAHYVGDLELRRRWTDERDADSRIPPHPAPEISARPALDSEVPKTALSCRVAAEKAGWRVEVTYARGTLPGGRELKVTDSIALRMRHPDGRRAVAVWTDGKADTALYRDPSMFPVKITVTEVKKLIVAPARVLVLAS